MALAAVNCLHENFGHTPAASAEPLTALCHLIGVRSLVRSVCCCRYLSRRDSAADRNPVVDSQCVADSKVAWRFDVSDSTNRSFGIWTVPLHSEQESFNSDLGAKIAVRDLELMGMDDFIYTLE